MRTIVADSWRRSAETGLDTECPLAPVTLSTDSLISLQASHPLASVFPLLDDVVGQAARDCGALMAVTDAQGQLLWVRGRSRDLLSAEAIGFVEGSNWDERMAGTNAPGLALKLDRTVTVAGAEHFRRSVRKWSCAAAPIHDPLTSSILGVIDVTGGPEVTKPQTVAMVRAAARMAEAEMARRMPAHSSTPVKLSDETQRLTLQALGTSEIGATVLDGSGNAQKLRFSRRHSEIILLLASAPRGLSGDEMAVHLYEDDNGKSTLRAELNRLRHLLGQEILLSRPYRLSGTVTGDWLAVEALLAAGDLARACQAYTGPVLPGSVAPGVVRLRDGVATVLRRAIMRSGNADLMAHWTRSWWGADDYDMWIAQLGAMDTASPFRPLVEGQIARLDRELGVRGPLRPAATTSR